MGTSDAERSQIEPESYQSLRSSAKRLGASQKRVRKKRRYETTESDLEDAIEQGEAFHEERMAELAASKKKERQKKRLRRKRELAIVKAKESLKTVVPNTDYSVWVLNNDLSEPDGTGSIAGSSTESDIASDDSELENLRHQAVMEMVGLGTKETPLVQQTVTPEQLRVTPNAIKTKLSTHDGGSNSSSPKKMSWNTLGMKQIYDSELR